MVAVSYIQRFMNIAVECGTLGEERSSVRAPYWRGGRESTHSWLREYMRGGLESTYSWPREYMRGGRESTLYKVKPCKSRQNLRNIFSPLYLLWKIVFIVNRGIGTRDRAGSVDERG